MNVADVEPVATTRDEDIGGDGVVEERFTASEVISQDGRGALMNGYKAPPAAFCAANGQDSGVEIHVAKLQVKRLGDA